MSRPTTAEGWEMRIVTTGEIVDAAPAEWRDEAATYLEMVKDRAELAADNGYVAVDALPADVREAFIAEHRDEQAEVNELIRVHGLGVRRRGVGLNVTAEHAVLLAVLRERDPCALVVRGRRHAGLGSSSPSKRIRPEPSRSTPSFTRTVPDVSRRRTLPLPSSPR